MRGFSSIFAVLFLGGCADKPPAWAFDPIWLEAQDDGRVHGFQTWTLYAKPWARRFDERHYECSAVVELSGSATPCGDCEAAFDVDVWLLEHDCLEGWLQDPLFTSLTRVAIGPPLTTPDAPYAGETFEGRADYGTGWEMHGYAYAASLDSARGWGADTPFQLWPTAAFPLN